MKTRAGFSPSLLVRTAIYLAIIAGILFVRFHGGKRPLIPGPAAVADSTLTVAGGSLAPTLLAAWAASWARDYPVRIVVRPGGTNQALEDLLEGRADVALLARPLTDAERSLFPDARDEAPPCFPVAFGALQVLRGAASPRREITGAELRKLLEGGTEARLYVPDPNFGWWDALCTSLGEDSAATGGVLFLANPDSVAVAVERDPASLGVVSALAPPAPRSEVVVVPVRSDSVPEAVLPDDASVAEGSYPLAHHLWAVCRPRARGAAAMFLTYLTSARGQRLVEREGFLPARRVAREVYLTTPSLPASP